MSIQRVFVATRDSWVDIQRGFKVLSDDRLRDYSRTRTFAPLTSESLAALGEALAEPSRSNFGLVGHRTGSKMAPLGAAYYICCQVLGTKEFTVGTFSHWEAYKYRDNKFTGADVIITCPVGIEVLAKENKLGEDDLVLLDVNTSPHDDPYQREYRLKGLAKALCSTGCQTIWQIRHSYASKYLHEFFATEQVVEVLSAFEEKERLEKAKAAEEKQLEEERRTTAVKNFLECQLTFQKMFRLHIVDVPSELMRQWSEISAEIKALHTQYEPAWKSLSPDTWGSPHCRIPRSDIEALTGKMETLFAEIEQTLEAPVQIRRSFATLCEKLDVIREITRTSQFDNGLRWQVSDLIGSKEDLLRTEPTAEELLEWMADAWQVLALMRDAYASSQYTYLHAVVCQALAL